MAYMNIRTPKFYTDTINFLMSIGTSQSSNFVVVSGSNLISTYVTGSEAELFDMKPMNQVTFNTTSSVNDHVLININKQSPNFKTDYIAILNHNMASANAKVRVGFGDSLDDINDVDLGSADNTMANPVEIINADNISSSIVTPDTDGSTIFTFDQTDEQYIGLQFEGGASGGSSFDGTDNLKIGCIMIGEHYTMPNAPDLSVKRSIIFDGVKVQQSLGGHKYSTATHLGRKYQNSKNKSLFLLATYPSGVYGGRIVYDMGFSYIDSSDLMPSDWQDEQEGADTVISDIWNRTKGNMIPFIFSNDSSSTGNRAESNYIFARFGQDSIDATQVAPDVFNLKLKIEEEF
jgi:hypothetical protein